MKLSRVTEWHVGESSSLTWYPLKYNTRFSLYLARFGICFKTYGAGNPLGSTKMLSRRGTTQPRCVCCKHFRCSGKKVSEFVHHGVNHTSKPFNPLCSPRPPSDTVKPRAVVMSEPKAPIPAPGDTYKGWLFKWTNYIKGYQRRWFVLSNGLLSYYRWVCDVLLLFIINLYRQKKIFYQVSFLSDNRSRNGW